MSASQRTELQLIVDRINQVSPHKDKKGLQRDPSLPTLLRDEQLYGTRERDPVVPRNDMYYFPANKMYLFVEDSTGEHRPVVIKEYDKPKKHEDPSWPILWGGVEGRSGFYHYDGPELTYERRQPPAPPAPAATAPTAPTATRTVAPNLRRAVSLQNVTRQQQLIYEQCRRDGAACAEREMNRRGGSYIAASGNSQIITSNIASATSTAARSGAAQASRNGANPYVDKRLAVLSNRNVSVSGGGLLGSAASASGGTASGGVAGATRNRVAALKQTERPAGGLKRSVSVDAGLHPPRFAAAAPVQREEVKKPGYCENCRIKYDDFSAHVRSSKHRRFALNQKNWDELDVLLAKIERRRLVDVDDDDEESEDDMAMQAESSEAESAHASSDGAGSRCDDSGYQEASFLREDVKRDGSAELAAPREDEMEEAL
jgi:regulatory subunit for Cdc7p protein kinase